MDQAKTMGKEDKIYITGHQNPDTDSICSALAYAELKNRLGSREAVPVRLGELNQESRFVLDYFQVEPPQYLESIQPILGDLSIDASSGISPDTTLYQATEIIQSNYQNNLAVVDEEDRLLGIISLSNIAHSYANIWNDNILGRAETPLTNIIQVLSAKPLCKPKEARPISGAITIYAMSHVDNDLISENDLVLVGDRREAQRDAIQKGVALLILTNGTEMAEDLLAQADQAGVTVLSTALSTYTAARLLPQAVPVGFLMTRENLVYFHTTDYLPDVRQKMASTRFRSYPVVDAQNRVVGSISRYHLINTRKKQVILVDHNEASQSIPDLDQAEILEIIDHHRVANVTTAGPIYFRNVPVGCTSTIISQLFYEQGIRPSRVAAGLMCSAIISDTLLFRSPTTTDQDRLAVARLAPVAGIDPEKYAMEMFRAGTDLTHKKAKDILTEDVKFFDIRGQKVRVAQVFTMEDHMTEELTEKLYQEMNRILREQGDDTYILLMTNIFEESSKVMVAGAHDQYVAREFAQTLQRHMFVAPGLLSRKKQLIPKLNHAISEGEGGQ